MFFLAVVLFARVHQLNSLRLSCPWRLLMLHGCTENATDAVYRKGDGAVAYYGPPDKLKW
jgi:hypothetical protein